LNDAMPRQFFLTPLVLILAAAAADSAMGQGLRLTTQVSPVRGAVLNAPSPPPAPEGPLRQADYIVALVNNEAITNAEVQLRMRRAADQLTTQGERLPTSDELRRMVVERLITERAQLQLAKDGGIKIDEAALNEAEQTIAAQNQLDVRGLHRRIQAEGMAVASFRDDLKNRLLLQRLREREVDSQVRVSDADIDQYLREQRASANPADQQINLAQILVEVPERATTVQVSTLQTRARRALERARAGEDFAALVREYSGAPDPLGGGQMGLRPADRYPELFLKAVSNLQPGDVADLVRSDAGFHIIKLIERQKPGDASTVTQQHVRHILLRLTQGRTPQQAGQMLETMRQRIVDKQVTFEQMAREQSQDSGSAAQGGDLGWSNPGAFVPEFEEVVTQLAPGEISRPTLSRYGVHLIQLLGRREAALSERQQRDLVRGQVRERKAEEAYADWLRELRGRAYVEFREPPGG
jgi:peptidyl-prolyl cis-trans isomerase SurA